MDNYEIERKYLLKSLPHNIDSLSIKDKYIDQYYLSKNQKITKKGDNEYMMVTKESIRGMLVRRERTSEITKREFNRRSQEAERYISKHRHYVLDSFGQNWHIDLYEGIALITAECETLIAVPDIDKINDEKIKDILPVSMPSFISKNLITEVTNQEEFYNYNLAKKLS